MRSSEHQRQNQKPNHVIKKQAFLFFRKATRHFFINLKKGEILFSTFNNFMGFYGMANNILNFLCFNLTLFNDERWTRQVANLELKYNNNDDIKLVMMNMMIIVRWGHWLTFLQMLKCKKESRREGTVRTIFFSLLLWEGNTFSVRCVE